MKVVHVAGAPGSGKTTFARTIEDWLRSNGEQDNVVVLDLDDVNRNFAEPNNYVPLLRENPMRYAELYQQHIDSIIEQARRENKSVLFVGINAALLGTWPGSENFLPVDLHSDFNFAIQVPVEVNARRWIQRDMPELVDDLAQRLKNDVGLYENYKDQEADFVRRYEQEFHELLRDFRPSQRKRDIEQFNQYFSEQDFTFAPQDQLEKLVKYALVQHL